MQCLSTIYDYCFIHLSTYPLNTKVLTVNARLGAPTLIMKTTQTNRFSRQTSTELYSTQVFVNRMSQERMHDSGTLQQSTACIFKQNELIVIFH